MQINALRVEVLVVIGRDQEQQPGTSRQWGENAAAAFAVRAGVFVAPLLLAFIVTWLLSKQWTAPETVVESLVRFAGLALVATVVAAAADRVARRLLPLAALLRLTLVFPDEAPSRFAIALRSNGTKKLESRLAELDSVSAKTSEAEAAKIIVELAGALSKHDRVTRGHSERVRAYTALIAEEMGLSPEDSNRLQWAGLIHDIGKLRIDEEILNKKGKLTDREYNIVKAHPSEGMRIAEPLRDFLGPWINAVGEHHERWDGGGYPNGLVGNQISLGARIVAVADVYDVITAARSYKAPESPAYAREEIARCAGSQFDPDVVRAFLNIGLGRVRRSMWPLSWVMQIPFLGTAATAPLVQTIVASAVTVATATGVAASGGGFAPILHTPDAIAFADSDSGSVDVAPAPTLPPAIADGFDLEPIIDGGDESSATATTLDTSTTTSSTTSSTTTITVAPTTSTTDVVPTTNTVTTIATTTSVQKIATTTTTAKPPTTTTAAPTTTTAVPITTTTTIVEAPIDDCERLTAGDHDLSNGNLQGCEIGDIDLSEVVFDGADLSGAHFVGTDLTFARFYQADLDGARFIEVTAPYAYMKKTTGSNVTFENSNFGESMFYGAELFDSTFVKSSFENSNFFGANLWGALIDDSDFSGVDLQYATFDNSMIGNSDFDQVVGKNATFESADVVSTSFDGALLHDVYFKRATLIDVSFDEATLVGAEFRESIHEGSSFELATLDSANFTLANITDSAFDESNAVVDGVIFERAEITSTSIEVANFPNANFAGAQIDGLEMGGASLVQANFSNTIGTPQDHFDAVLDGAICPSGELLPQGSESCW